MTDTHEIMKAQNTQITQMIPQQHPLVAAAIAAGNIDTEALGKLMDLQERYEANLARKEFAEAMIQLKIDLPAVIAHDKVVDYERTHYTHSSLAIVMREVVPHLSNHGFSMTWNPSTPSRDLVSVEGVLSHRGGHSEKCTLQAPPDRKGGKNDAQAVSSTVTLLSRYTGAALLGIATADMDEISGKKQRDDESKVDVQKNLRSLSKLKGYGISKEQAEQFTGKSVEQWTSSDLIDLGDMVKQQTGA
jgi:hypothetical protein